MWGFPAEPVTLVTAHRVEASSVSWCSCFDVLRNRVGSRYGGVLVLEGAIVVEGEDPRRLSVEGRSSQVGCVRTIVLAPTKGTGEHRKPEDDFFCWHPSEAQKLRTVLLWHVASGVSVFWGHVRSLCLGAFS